MNFEFVDPTLEPRWNDWVLGREAGNIFHTAEWARVLMECYRYPVHYGVLKDGPRIVGLLPMMEVASVVTGRRGVSLPFSDECAPLLSSDVSLKALVEPVRSLGRQLGWDFLELRGEAASLPGAVCSEVQLVHYLKLEATEEAQFKKLKDSHRRNIQKAQKEGVEIHCLQTIEAVDTYYELHCLTRQRQGVPPQPREFFRAIYEFLIAGRRGFVLLARYRHNWIAGAVFLYAGSQALYKFGASDLAYQHLRANNLLMWEAIRHFRAAGLREFSFGRTDPSNAGLLQFKRGWGAEEVPLRYYRLPVRKELEQGRTERLATGRAVSKIMQRMPMSMLRVLGAVAYRHMG